MGKKEKFIEVEITGDYAMFSEPEYRIGGEKSSYPIPTYEALKGIMMSASWKPTFLWVIDEVKIMNPIRYETKGIRTVHYAPERKDNWNDLSFYKYLRNCRYRVRAHYEWNLARPDLEVDRSYSRFNASIADDIKKGGRRDIYLGTRECQGYIAPCVFDEGAGAYDELGRVDFGMMYHGITYPNEPCNTTGKMIKNMWTPVMEKSVIKFERPENCPVHIEVGSTWH